MIGIDQMQYCSRLDLVYNHKFLILRAKHHLTTLSCKALLLPYA
jgi:hypothetical protein